MFCNQHIRLKTNVKDIESASALSNREIKEKLTLARVDFTGVIEREELLKLMGRVIERELFNRTSRPAPASPQANQAASENSVRPLPDGWEMRHDSAGRAYYVDHNSRVTSWERPAILPQGVEKRFDNGKVIFEVFLTISVEFF